MSEDCKKELETQADESAADRQIGIGKMRVGPYEDAEARAFRLFETINSIEPGDVLISAVWPEIYEGDCEELFVMTKALLANKIENLLEDLRRAISAYRTDPFAGQNCETIKEKLDGVQFKNNQT
jgi:hypothetical protein